MKQDIEKSCSCSSRDASRQKGKKVETQGYKIDANNSGGASNSKFTNSSTRDTNDISNIWLAISSRDACKCSQWKPTIAATPPVKAGMAAAAANRGLHAKNRAARTCRDQGMPTILWTPATVAMPSTRGTPETGLTAAAIGKSETAEMLAKFGS